MSTLHVKPGDDPMEAWSAAMGVKMHRMTEEEAAERVKESIKRTEAKAEKIRVKGHDCEKHRVAGGPPGWLCGLCGDDAAHDCEQFLVFVASPGGRRLVHYCDLCGEQQGWGGWVAPGDPTWEEFLARTPGEYTRERLLGVEQYMAQHEAMRKVLVVAKGHYCYDHQALAPMPKEKANRNFVGVYACRLCGEETGALPF